MLEIKNLQINLSSDESIIINNASFVMDKGEIILLEGQNGSGKSSLLNAIFKNPKYNINAGEIVLDGENIINKETHELARSGLYLSLQHVPEIAGVSTIKFLYKAYESINGEDKKFSILELKNYLEEKCEKYNLDKNLLSRDVNVGFSGGEKKQAELLHILALNPKYIFMDEPDSGVDVEAVNKVYTVINDIVFGGASVLVTSHNSDTSKLNITKTYILKDKILEIKN